MSEGLNRAILIGNLGQVPELRHTQSSTVLNLRIATTESFLDHDKQRQERTEWHTVVVWGRRAEALSKILSKGDRVGVEGRIQTRSWDGTDGAKRYSTEIVATNVLLLGGRREARQESDRGNGVLPAPADEADEHAAAQDSYPF